MKKTIILLSGSPNSKNRFAEMVKNIAWIWEINSKDYLRENLRLFSWDGNRTEEINKLVEDQLKLYNERFDFERKFLKDRIERFLSDEGEFKKSSEGKVFDKFVLIVHGVSKELVPFLQEEYGIFRVHLSKKEYNSNERFPKDITILYDDENNFSLEVNRIIEVLTKP